MIFVKCLSCLKQSEELWPNLVIQIGMCTTQLSMVLLSLQSMVMCDLTNRTDETKLFSGDIHQMPIMPEAIWGIVAKLGDLNHNVCRTASNGLVELAKHGDLYLFQIGQIELICF